MQGVVFAAGRGVRLKPITDEIPKCMVSVKGKPILERIMEKMVKVGVEEIELVVGYKKDIVEEHFGPEFSGVKINYFVQEEQKGTAHALSLVEEQIKDKFLVTNSDVLTIERNYKKLVETDEFEKVDGLVLARTVKDPWRFGVLKTDAKKILDIIEKPSPGEEPSDLISTGVYRFKKDFFESVHETQLSSRGEYELVDSIKNYISKGKLVEYKPCEGTCIDIATQEDLEKANEMPKEMFPE